jgi:hypothetical protein
MQHFDCGSLHARERGMTLSMRESLHRQRQTLPPIVKAVDDGRL